MDLDEILEAYTKMRYFIFSYGVPSLPPYMELEDLWHDILVDGLTRVPVLYRPELSKLTTFVAMRGVYYIKNFRTKQSRRKFTLYPLDPSYEPEGREPIDTTDYKKLIFRLTEGMPVKFRMILRFKSCGLTDDAIGVRLGVTRQRIDQLYHKASKALREAFDLDVEEEREGDF